MANPTGDEIGYSINLPGGVGDKATPVTISNFFQLTNAAWAIIFDVNFADDNHNVFLGFSAGGQSFKLTRNATAGEISLEMIDLGGNHRDYTWTAPLNRGGWYQFILRGIDNNADGVELYIDGAQKTASAQVNDAGYSPSGSDTFSFGDIDGVNLGAMKIANPVFMARTLALTEITEIYTLKKYPEDFFYGWKFKRPNIGLNKAITLVA